MSRVASRARARACASLYPASVKYVTRRDAARRNAVIIRYIEIYGHMIAVIEDDKKTSGRARRRDYGGAARRRRRRFCSPRRQKSQRFVTVASSIGESEPESPRSRCDTARPDSEKCREGDQAETQSRCRRRAPLERRRPEWRRAHARARVLGKQQQSRRRRTRGAMSLGNKRRKYPAKWI